MWLVGTLAALVGCPCLGAVVTGGGEALSGWWECGRCVVGLGGWRAGVLVYKQNSIMGDPVYGAP